MCVGKVETLTFLQTFWPYVSAPFTAVVAIVRVVDDDATIVDEERTALAVNSAYYSPARSTSKAQVFLPKAHL